MNERTNETNVTVTNTKTGKTEEGRKVILCESPLLVAYIVGTRIMLSMPQAN